MNNYFLSDHTLLTLAADSTMIRKCLKILGVTKEKILTRQAFRMSRPFANRYELHEAKKKAWRQYLKEASDGTIARIVRRAGNLNNSVETRKDALADMSEIATLRPEHAKTMLPVIEKNLYTEFKPGTSNIHGPALDLLWGIVYRDNDMARLAYPIAKAYYAKNNFYHEGRKIGDMETDKTAYALCWQCRHVLEEKALNKLVEIGILNKKEVWKKTPYKTGWTPQARPATKLDRVEYSFTKPFGPRPQNWGVLRSALRSPGP